MQAIQADEWNSDRVSQRLGRGDSDPQTRIGARPETDGDRPRAHPAGDRRQARDAFSRGTRSRPWRRPASLISSNTSPAPVASAMAARSVEVSSARRFIGIHPSRPRPLRPSRRDDSAARDGITCNDPRLVSDTHSTRPAGPQARRCKDLHRMRRGSEDGCNASMAKSCISVRNHDGVDLTVSGRFDLSFTACRH